MELLIIKLLFLSGKTTPQGALVAVLELSIVSHNLHFEDLLSCLEEIESLFLRRMNER